MEHFKSPFGGDDLDSDRALENGAFFSDLLARAGGHRFFSHDFICALGEAPIARDVVSFVLTSFYRIVSPFTGLLCSLGGRAPNLRSRFALMDNIYEEMGCGDLNAAHPTLYLKMLRSIGVTESSAESLPELSPIGRINEHLNEVVGRRPFAVAAAVLASAEATIPPSFPVLARMARRAFPQVDLEFFDRHGVRDEGHSSDASMLFAVTADRSIFDSVERAVWLDLDHRAELFDEWTAVIGSGRVPRAIEHPIRAASASPSTRPPAMVMPM